MSDADKRIDALERRVAELERQGATSKAIGPKPQTPWFPEPRTMGEKPRCGKCGIELHGVMGYVCPSGGDCPTGLGGFSC
jgi:hypothetical protein